MKSRRKLFAILTLVAFMMTLLPIAAFAGDADLNVASKSASKIAINAGSKPAGNDSTVEVTVALRDGSNKAANSLGDKDLFIWAERAKDSLSDVDMVVEDSVTVAGDAYTEHDNYLVVTDLDSNSNGTVKVKFTSGVAGEVTFKAALADDGANISDVVGKDANQIGSQSFEWKQLGAGKIVLKSITGGKNDDFKVGEYDNGVYSFEGFQADGNDYELKFSIQDRNGAPLAGEKVEFSLNKSKAHLTKTEATSDVLGEVKVKVYAYEADDYKLTVKKGNVVTVVNLDFGGSDDAFEITAPDAITDKVALDTEPSLEFKAFDVFANRILTVKNDDAIDTEKGLGKVAKDINDDDGVVFSKIPSASSLEDDDISVVATTGHALKVDFSRNPDVAGTYEVKVKLPNGKFATASFQAAEQGDITKMVLDIKESYLAYDSESSKIKVKYYDNNNVFYEDDTLSTVELSVSNTSLATITGDNTVKARKASYNNFNTGKVVVTAIDTARALVGTDEITIGSLVAGLEVNVPEEATLLNQDAKVTYQLVNQNGDAIAFDAAKKSAIDVDAYIVSKPADANVDINLPLKSDYQNSLSRTGKIDVQVESDKEGTVVLAFVVKGDIGEDKEEVITLSNTVDVKFVAERVKIGAKNVTMFIGSTGFVVDGAAKVTDLAPFIKDNRTFVPVRMVATALGAANEDTMWDEATQTVTLEREDKTITLTIGSNVINVSDGSTIVSDVAPFIVDGRTVLPFRAIGEAFGADVEAIFGADGTTIAVTFQQ